MRIRSSYRLSEMSDNNVYNSQLREKAFKGSWNKIFEMEFRNKTKVVYKKGREINNFFFGNQKKVGIYLVNVNFEIKKLRTSQK